MESEELSKRQTNFPLKETGALGKMKKVKQKTTRLFFEEQNKV